MAEVAKNTEASARRTSPIELLWDLVFVFAVTQVSTLLARDLSWAGFARAMLVLALVWWAWSAFVWATNAQDPASGIFRGVILLATVLIFLVGLAVPQAFGSEGLIFAVTYTGVRLFHSRHRRILSHNSDRHGAAHRRRIHRRNLAHRAVGACRGDRLRGTGVADA
jgi:low temperature requirement protein LtrA